MKKLLWIAVMVISLSLAAQNPRFGITGGYNLTTKNLSIENTDLADIFNRKEINMTTSGFFIGGLLDVEFSEKFYLQTELNYNRIFFKEDYGLNLLAIALVAKYYIAKPVYLQIGPYLDSYMDDFSIGLGLTTGLGVDISDDFFISARYSFGIMERINMDILFLGIIGLQESTNYLQIGVGYKF